MQGKLFRPKEYFRPRTIEDALSLLEKHRGAVVLAGGTDLLVMKPPEAEYIIDITRLPLGFIKVDESGIKIGAITTIWELETSAQLKEEPYNVLTEAARNMGTPITKNISTVGGNICTAASSADMPPALMVLDAEAKIVNSSGEKKIPLEEFFTGPKEHCLKKDELLAEVFVPHAPDKTKAVFVKKGRTREDIAQVNAAVRITLGSENLCKVARVALGAVAPTPVRAKEAESMLEGKKLENISQVIDEVARTASEATKPISDIRASAEYREEVTKALVKRALGSIVEKFGGG